MFEEIMMVSDKIIWIQRNYNTKAIKITHSRHGDYMSSANVILFRIDLIDHNRNM